MIEWCTLGERMAGLRVVAEDGSDGTCALALRALLFVELAAVVETVIAIFEDLTLVAL